MYDYPKCIKKLTYKFRDPKMRVC